MEPRFLLTVKVPKGIVVRDTPRPESQGGRAMRSVPVGMQLYAYSIHNIGGVDYALLMPQIPQRPEWVRVAEADHSIEYVDVVELMPKSDVSELASAVALLATAVHALARK